MTERKRMERAYVLQALKALEEKSRLSYFTLIGIGIYFRFTIEDNEENMGTIKYLSSVENINKETIISAIFHKELGDEFLQ
ncbi:hypothetical protein [uncultured Cetobacterium sp.]|uniref:hypothetical protein n=1 Tax=uncultured Cetobacterium sp. TaxID=527638 RepID=UPI0026316CDA|nr:hypothetical protein [uncultured Cetobacterium sp.]